MGGGGERRVVVVKGGWWWWWRKGNEWSHECDHPANSICDDMGGNIRDLTPQTEQNAQSLFELGLTFVST